MRPLVAVLLIFAFGVSFFFNSCAEKGYDLPSTPDLSGQKTIDITVPGSFELRVRQTAIFTMNAVEKVYLRFDQIVSTPQITLTVNDYGLCGYEGEPVCPGAPYYFSTINLTPGQSTTVLKYTLRIILDSVDPVSARFRVEKF